jgi:hypothetical protein
MSERDNLNSVWRSLRLIAACAIFAVSPVSASAQSVVPKAGACLSLFDPVCARKKNELVNYANACIAASEGAKVLAKGGCPQGCPMVYQPVCAEDAQGVRRNYGNACAAEKDGAKIIRNRRCFITFGRRSL